MSVAEMSKELDVKPYQINYYLRKNNLTNRKTAKHETWASFTQEDIDYIKNNYQAKSYKEIGDILGFTERQIRGKVNNMGLGKTRKINADYFKFIDTPIKAYFLGFIFADGWICANTEKRIFEFGMELQSQDRYILEKLNDEIGGLNIIKHFDKSETFIKDHVAHSGESDCLRVYSRPLVENLINAGIETNKTRKDIYPIVDEHLFFDWLRGYIDGDGCYYTNKNINTYMHITCASLSPLTYIKDKLQQYGIKTNIYSESEKKHRLMCTNKEDMCKLINYLYYDENIFCLKRKFEKIKHLLCLTA